VTLETKIGMNGATFQYKQNLRLSKGNSPQHTNRRIHTDGPGISSRVNSTLNGGVSGLSSSESCMMQSAVDMH
jgi:hypothetical protein